jgi:general secretion pathway protein G
MKAKTGFTLVEILIVVVILGILAAVVIPQFTEASTEARESTLMSDLQTLRSQIELYKVQHNDDPPALATFEEQMTQTSDIDGTASGDKVADADAPFGPYLQSIPTNPFTDGDSVVDWATSTAESSDGWEYEEDTGEIRAAVDTTDDTAAHQGL